MNIPAASSSHLLGAHSVGFNSRGSSLQNYPFGKKKESCTKYKTLWRWRESPASSRILPVCSFQPSSFASARILARSSSHLLGAHFAGFNSRNFFYSIMFFNKKEEPCVAQDSMEVAGIEPASEYEARRRLHV